MHWDICQFIQGSTPTLYHFMSYKYNIWVHFLLTSSQCCVISIWITAPQTVNRVFVLQNAAVWYMVGTNKLATQCKWLLICMHLNHVVQQGAIPNYRIDIKKVLITCMASAGFSVFSLNSSMVGAYMLMLNCCWIRVVSLWSTYPNRTKSWYANAASYKRATQQSKKGKLK